MANVFLPLVGSLLLTVLVASQTQEEDRELERFKLDKIEKMEVESKVEERLAAERANEEKFKEIDAIVSRPKTSVSQHRAFTFTSPMSVEKGRNHRRNILAVEEGLKLKDVPDKSIKPLLEHGFGPKVFCEDNCTCDINSPYRTADGRCNNLVKTTWGMASIPMRRWLYPAYQDGISSPRQRTADGSSFLPSARSVSVKVHKHSTSGDLHDIYTHMLMQWGQFLDHDITATAVQQRGGYPSSSAACCEDILFTGSGITQSELDSRPECFPIKIVQPDRHFLSSCMNFIRSVQVENAQCKPAPAEQLNQITAYIDASNVYGSSAEEQNSLRDKTSGLGLLKDVAPAPYLPKNPDSSSCTTPFGGNDYCFKAGDHRVNENPTLQSMHTIFMREHNRIAKALKKINCHWGDEKLFQEARKIVGAMMQEITYSEYLPIVLGDGVMTSYGLKLAHPPSYTHFYSTGTDASIRNAFATAAFRFGHSMISDFLSSRNIHFGNYGNDQLSNVFGNTHQILSAANREVDTYARGLVKDRVQNVDAKISKEVTDRLFIDSNNKSLDLAALNIQRGRDHGLPSYVEWRKFCNMADVNDFSDLDTHEISAQNQLSSVYSSVKDIDLFPGALSEKHVTGGLVGPTFACLIAKQFKTLKTGDRFWFEEDNDNVRFSPDQLAELHKASLSRVVCDNTNTYKIQKNAFIKGTNVLCKTLPSIDLTKWKVGSWSEWSKWGPCEKDGIQRRTRKCEPCNCGCVGDNVESRICLVSEKPCGWTAWGTCISGQRQRQCKCPGFGTEICKSIFVANNFQIRTRK